MDRPSPSTIAVRFGGLQWLAAPPRVKLAGFRESVYDIQKGAEKEEPRGAKPLWRGSGGVPRYNSPPFWEEERGSRLAVWCFSSAC